MLFWKVPFGTRFFPQIVLNTQMNNNYFQKQHENEQEKRKKP